ncbi:MAG: [NiFe]-hydrogenase assembly chaperone HybE [Rhodomicrobium sp.]
MAEALSAMEGEAGGGTGSAMADKLTRDLEGVFRNIQHERMQDIPILNPALSVADIGMRLFSDAWLSVLVTPWFINLMVLPGSEADADAWASVPAGSKIVRQFPAGAFEFICSAEDGIGPYQMCSLFSPVLEFENQEAAMAAAEAALNALFDASLHPDRSKEHAASAPPLQEKPATPAVSRRDLLRGNLTTPPVPPRQAP